MTVRLVLALVAALLVAACTSNEPTADETKPTADPSPRFEIPVALLVHHGRAVSDISLEQARAVLAGDVDDWADLGGRSGPINVVSAGVAAVSDDVGRESDPRAAVEAAATDRDTLAVVPADAATPRVRALTVDGENPLRAGADHPLTTAVAARPAPVLVTAITGDIMLGRRVGDRLRRINDPAAALRPFAKRLAGADITVGNLESTLSDAGAPQQGGNSFAADPSALEGLELAGYDALSLGNNHFGDFQRRAMLQTVDRLADAGFATFGGGRDLAQARAPAIIERRGVRIGFIGTDSIGETPAATRNRPGTNRISTPPRTPPLDQQALDRVADDIRALDARVDVVVVMPHWGVQYTAGPHSSQRRLGRVFVEAGADLVAGGHPHWVQGWETIGGTTIVHSIGNFVFDMSTRENQQGLILEMVTRGDRVVAVDTVPYVIGPRDFTPRPAGPERTDAIFDLVRSASEPPFDQLRP